MFAIVKADGYIVGVVSGHSVSGEVVSEVVSEAEYQRIRAAIMDRPEPVPGYGWRLREDLQWERYELPPGPDFPEEATVADYRAALEEMGVSL